jgi:hypothetical protein
MRTPWRLLLIAWPVLAVLYTLILVGNAEWPWPQGAILGGLTIGVALLLGVPVWHLTGRVHIPDGFRELHPDPPPPPRSFPLWLVVDLVSAVLSPLAPAQIATMGWETILVSGCTALSPGKLRRRGRHAAARRSWHPRRRSAQAAEPTRCAPGSTAFLLNALHLGVAADRNGSIAPSTTWVTCCGRRSGLAHRPQGR